ncbi:MAG: NAD(P)/FAD-dependent oxidoreductase [Acidimicrobiales bacterium]
MSSGRSAQQVVVVGASLAGLSAAAELRQRGFEGSITIVGAERHLPYDRPPLSKQFLQGRVDEAATALDLPPDLDLHWILGEAATGLDLSRRVARIAGAEELHFDSLVIATGAVPRELPLRQPPEGVHTLRTLDDAMALRAAVAEGGPVAVIGGGIIGLEVAASCRSLGLEVTVLEALGAPLIRALGPEMGAVCARLHSDHGVTIRVGVKVEALEGHPQLEAVRLADGSVVEARIAVVGVGVAPSTSWLDGSGVDVADGVCCDSSLRVLVGGRPLPGVVAAGDVARWPHPRYGDVRLEHWTNASEQGAAAARTLLDGEDAAAYGAVPYFWSDQFDAKIQLVGLAAPGDAVQVVEGSPEERRFAAVYGRHGEVVAAIGFNKAKSVMALKGDVATGAPFPLESR